MLNETFEKDKKPRNFNRTHLLGILIIVAILSITLTTIPRDVPELKVNASEDINKSIRLMDKGAELIDEVDTTFFSPSIELIKLESSESYYNEAIKILNNATTDYDEEKEIIELNKVICNYSLDVIFILKNLAVGMEHFDKADAYIVSGDMPSVRLELNLAEAAIDNTIPLITSAKEKISSIETDSIPVDLKIEVLEDRKAIEKSEIIILEVSDMIAGMHPFVDGMEHLFKAVDHIEDENWKSAGKELGKSNADFSKSKNVMISLKNSTFSEVSVGAIEMDGLLRNLIKAISHFELGCNYADKGDYVGAFDEFMKAELALSGGSIAY